MDPKDKNTTEHTIKSHTHYRSAEVVKDGIDVEARTVELSFSSSFPVRRDYGMEILDHSEGAADLSRFKDGASVRDSHTGDQIGIVEDAVIVPAKEQGRAKVRFGKAARAQEIFQDVVDGIRRNVSFFYTVARMKLEREETGLKWFRATQWAPVHLSFEPDGADPTVGVGRHAVQEIEITVTEPKERKAKPKMETEEKTTLTPATTVPTVDVKAERDLAMKAERIRGNEIRAIGGKFNQLDFADKAINEGMKLEDFRAAIMKDLGPTPILSTDPAIGMDEKEVREYSLVRAMRLAGNQKPLDGLELEASRAVATKLGKDPQGFFVPFEVRAHKMDVHARQMRALSAGIATAGGYTVGTDVLGDNMIDLLRNRQITIALGARTLGGLQGNLSIPKATGGATASWLAENTEDTATQQTFGQLALTPHRLSAITAYSKQLLAQSSIDIEGFVRGDLATVMAIEKDRAALNGSGVSGEPLGILNTTGINTVTFGATATWAKAIEFETKVATDNALFGSIAYVTTAAVRGAWKAIDKSTSTAQFIWMGKEVNGYRAEVTQQVPSNLVILGNWADLLIADWDGMDVVVDPFTLAAFNQVRIVVNTMSDVGVRNPVSFAVSTDSGAQ